MIINDSWKSENIPEKQYEIVKRALEDFRGGKTLAVWETVLNFLKTLEGKELFLLDAGCASGYFYELFSSVLPGKFKYMGGDYSEHMINLAKKNYPNTEFCNLDVRNIQFNDKYFDVVFSCACLEHIKDEWKKGLQELCRVSKKYLVLHKTPLIDSPTKFTERKIYGDNLAVFNKFNKRDFFLVT